MRTCMLCKEPTTSRYAKYCRLHRGGGVMPKYGACAATHKMIKSAMMTTDEAAFFSELAQAHKLNTRQVAEQLLLVHSFLIAIQIRREAEQIHKGRGDASLLQRLVTTHASITDKLGLCASKGKPPTEDHYGVQEFLRDDGPDNPN
jgi:hypothetical protein